MYTYIYIYTYISSNSATNAWRSRAKHVWVYACVWERRREGGRGSGVSWVDEREWEREREMEEERERERDRLKQYKNDGQGSLGSFS
jgi:hypothetical protein